MLHLLRLASDGAEHTLKESVPDGIIKEDRLGLDITLHPSKAVGGNSGPTGNSKVRWHVARAARDQRDFHHYVGLFERCERLRLKDRKQDRPDRRIKVG
jgi:hypothetical protein